MKSTLNVLTLNCWGIPYVSKDKNDRINAISKYFATSSLDLVCLQEIWSRRDFIFISTKCKSNLPYCHYFNSGVIGSGLCILSKYPILDVHFHQYPINGYAHKIHQGDWFGGKGVALCSIDVEGLLVHLYTAHLHAEYSINATEYLSHRVLQAFEASQFIKLTSGESDLIILAGDLNTEPDDLALKLLKLNAHLEDCYLVAQQKNSDCCLGTNESSRNSYTPSSELKRLPEGKRIDYILYKNSSKINVNIQEYCYPLPKLVPGCPFSYSDHEAVSSIFEISENSDPPSGKQSEIKTETFCSALNDAIDICTESLNKLKTTQLKYLYSSFIFGTLLLIFLFVEIFFNIPVEYHISYTAYIVCFNLLKVICTCIFLFCLLMGTLWNKIERSAIIYGKHAMKIKLEPLCKKIEGTSANEYS